MISNLTGKEAEGEGGPYHRYWLPWAFFPSFTTIPFHYSDGSCRESFQASAQAPSHLIEGRIHSDIAVFTALLCQAEGGARARDGLCTHHPYARWKVDEKIAALSGPQPIGPPLCWGWSPSLKQNGEEHQEQNTDLQDVVNLPRPRLNSFLTWVLRPLRLFCLD